MAVEIVSIGSSSSGNSYIILAGSRTILLDVGLTAKKIIGALEHFDIAPEEVDAVLVTHEHVDHVKSVRAISRKCCNAVFYTSRGTYEATENFAYVPEERLRIVAAGDSVVLGDHQYDSSVDGEASGNTDNAVSIDVFPLSHDAREPLGYAVSCGGEKLAVVTDTGIITDDIYEAIKDAGKLVFESNHDEHLLMFGEYPYYVKQRIKSDLGHLSNDYAGNVLSRLLSERYENLHPETGIFSGSAHDEYIDLEADLDNEPDTDPGADCIKPGSGGNSAGDKAISIMLAHLSEHNNLPLYASQAVEAALNDSGFRRGVHYKLTIAAKETLTIMK